MIHEPHISGRPAAFIIKCHCLTTFYRLKLNVHKNDAPYVPKVSYTLDAQILCVGISILRAVSTGSPSRASFAPSFRSQSACSPDRTQPSHMRPSLLLRPTERYFRHLIVNKWTFGVETTRLWLSTFNLSGIVETPCQDALLES